MAVQMYIWDGVEPVKWDGSVAVVVSPGSAFAISDGASTTIKATVRDYLNSNPLAVVLTNTTGDAYIANTTSFTGTVDQGTGGVSAWLVTASNFDIRDLAFATDKVDVSGSSITSTVSGTVAVSNFPASQVVTATDLDIRNLVFATDKVDASGSTGIGVTGPLTDTQLRATPVPVSGTVTANAGTNLNTSLLALEAGGHLATIDTSTAASAAVEGTTAGAAVITDANGTIQQYLRGLIKLAITAGGFLVTATLGAGSALIGLVGRKFTYAAPVTLTDTNWLSLASGTGWQSDAIATGGASEIQFNLTTFGAAGSTLLADFYLAEAFTSGNFTDAATGTEGTFTAAGRKNSRFLGSIQLNGAASVTGCLKYTDVSGSLCEKVALIGINNSGGTISATGGNTTFTYELIN